MPDSHENSIDAAEFLAYAYSYEMVAKIILSDASLDLDTYSIEADDPWQQLIELKFHQYGLFSIFFLVRHYLELKLKGLILSNGGKFLTIKTHSLKVLIENLGKLIGSDRIPPMVVEYIHSLDRFDATSEGLRYPYDNRGIKFNLGSPEDNISNFNADRQNLINRVQERFELISNHLTNLEHNLAEDNH